MNENKLGDALTEKAVKAYSQIADPRLRELTASLIRHLHAFVKETKLTDQEFEIAWTLMAEMAKFTGDERNEYLLFCDAIAISELIDAINHQRPPTAVDTLSSARSTAPMLRGESGASRSSATILKETGFASAAESTSWPPVLPSPAQCSMCGRQLRTGCTKTRMPTNPITTSGAGSRPTKTAPLSWWHCCRHPTLFPPTGRSANC